VAPEPEGRRGRLVARRERDPLPVRALDPDRDRARGVDVEVEPVVPLRPDRAAREGEREEREPAGPHFVSSTFTPVGVATASRSPNGARATIVWFTSSVWM
jgi:hypothetical protein